MKKLFVTLLTIVASGAVYALPVGNPSEASLLCDGFIWEGHCGDPCDPCLSWFDAFSVRFGFYGDYVFNRNLQNDDENDNDIERTQLFTNAGYIAANFYDRLDFFATLGATKILIDTNDKAFGFGGTGRFALETESSFSWSMGARGSIWECGCTTLGAEFQYFYTKPHLTRATLTDSTSIYPQKSVNAKYREWQAGIGLSHRINLLVPYVAYKVSGVHLNWGDATLGLPGVGIPAEFQDMKNGKHSGFAVGVSLIDCEKAALTAEGRFGDEKALYVNGQIRF